VTPEEYSEGEFGYILLDLGQPHIAWLAYLGVIYSCDITEANPGNISWWLTNTVRRPSAPRFEREALLEQVRTEEFPNELSRLSAVYSFPDINSARRGMGELRGRDLVAIEPASNAFTRAKHDMNWIDYPGDQLSIARRYWSGEDSDEPIYEQLLSGQFYICGTAVRKKAYDCIKRAFPDSLAILELARLAPYFGFKLGQISPWVKQDGEDLVFAYIIRYEEPEGVEILKATMARASEEPSFQVNWKDLEPLRDLHLPCCVPDLRPFESRVSVSDASRFAQLVRKLPR
jgi:hypothetical protein